MSISKDYARDVRTVRQRDGLDVPVYDIRREARVGDNYKEVYLPLLAASPDGSSSTPTNYIFEANGEPYATVAGVFPWHDQNVSEICGLARKR